MAYEVIIASYKSSKLNRLSNNVHTTRTCNIYASIERDRVTQMTHNALYTQRLGNKSYRRLQGGK